MNKDLEYLDSKNLCFVCIAENSITLVSQTGSMIHLTKTNPNFHEIFNRILDSVEEMPENQDKWAYGGNEIWEEFFKNIGDELFKNVFVTHWIFEDVEELE